MNKIYVNASFFLSIISLGSLIVPSSASADGHRWSLWWQNRNGEVARWEMSDSTRIGSSRLNTSGQNSGSRVVGSGDFSNHSNHQEDIIWQHDDGAVSFSCTDGTNCTDEVQSNSSHLASGWEVRATGDLMGDGSTDLVVEHTSGWLGVWAPNRANAAQQYLTPSKVDPTWKVSGTSDMDQDGQSDVVFQHDDGRIAVWFMNGTKRTGTSYLHPARVDPAWRLVGAYDLNGDGKKELLWRNIRNGRVSYWEMDGTNRVRSGPLTPASADLSWNIVGPR